MITQDGFFLGYDESRRLFDTLRDAIDAIGPAELQLTKSQIAFRRRKAFAWAWIPGKYLRGKTAPLVLTLSFRSRDPSARKGHEQSMCFGAVEHPWRDQTVLAWALDRRLGQSDAQPSFWLPTAERREQALTMAYGTGTIAQ